VTTNACIFPSRSYLLTKCPRRPAPVDHALLWRKHHRTGNNVNFFHLVLLLTVTVGSQMVDTGQSGEYCSMRNLSNGVSEPVLISKVMPVQKVNSK
jgi:hypothetical protein